MLKGAGTSVKGGAVVTTGKVSSHTVSGKSPRLPSNVAPPNSVPAHMARRVEKGSVGLKGKWTHWPGEDDGAS
jgi:hypothetical protein